MPMQNRVAVITYGYDVNRHVWLLYEWQFMQIAPFLTGFYYNSFRSNISIISPAMLIVGG